MTDVLPRHEHHDPGIVFVRPAADNALGEPLPLNQCNIMIPRFLTSDDGVGQDEAANHPGRLNFAQLHVLHHGHIPENAHMTGAQIEHLLNTRVGIVGETHTKILHTNAITSRPTLFFGVDGSPYNSIVGVDRESGRMNIHISMERKKLWPKPRFIRLFYWDEQGGGLVDNRGGDNTEHPFAVAEYQITAKPYPSVAIPAHVYQYVPDDDGDYSYHSVSNDRA